MIVYGFLARCILGLRGIQTRGEEQGQADPPEQMSIASNSQRNSNSNPRCWNVSVLVTSGTPRNCQEG